MFALLFFFFSHLQETKEALESELKNLKAEMEENKVEKERLKVN